MSRAGVLAMAAIVCASLAVGAGPATSVSAVLQPSRTRLGAPLADTLASARRLLPACCVVDGLQQAQRGSVQRATSLACPSCAARFRRCSRTTQRFLRQQELYRMAMRWSPGLWSSKRGSHCWRAIRGACRPSLLWFGRWCEQATCLVSRRLLAWASLLLSELAWAEAATSLRSRHHPSGPRSTTGSP